MLKRGFVSMDALLLCASVLLASLLMASAEAIGLPSTTAPSANAKAPCDPKDGSKRVKVAAERAQSVNCSSAEECVRLAQQYLAWPGGARLALQPLEKAVALDPENAEAYKKLASAYLRKNEGIDSGRLSREEYCRAQTACRKAIFLAPHDAEAFLLLGKILAGEVYNEFRTDDAAVEAIKTAIELKPGWADAYCELARAYNWLKRYEEAAAAYTEEARLRRNQFEQDQSSSVLEFRKGHDVADAFVVAQIYAKLGKYDKSLASLNYAASLNPEDDLIRYWICKTFLSLGDIRSARRAQELLAELCKSKSKFFVSQCKGRAQDILDAIEKEPR